MKSYLYDLLKYQGDLTWQQIFSNVGFSAVLGFVIFLSYFFSHRGTLYSKKFNVTLVALTVMTGTVMTVIGNNIALSLGMVGALSIVRFRTAIKDSRDTVYIFCTIIAGICCGVGDYFVASVGSTVIFLVLLVLGAIRSDTRMLLIIRGSSTSESKVEALVFQYFNRNANLRVKNTTPNTVEFIFELSRKTLEQAQKKHVTLTQDLFAIGGLDTVNFVAQNDEIYS